MKDQPKTSLFRQAAITHNGPALLEGLVIRSGNTTYALAWAALGLVIGLVFLLLFATYERRERVPGYVAPTAGLVRVLPPRVGVIVRVEVADGQEVAAGEPLFSLSSLRGIQSGADADVVQVEALKREQATVKARVGREVAVAEARVKDTRRRIYELQRQSQSIRGQQRFARERVELMNRDLARLESLRDGGHVSAGLIDERQGELLSAQKNFAAFDREFDDLRSQIGALESELKVIPLQLGIRQDELQGRLFEIERMLAKAEMQEETIVRAPVSGRVTSLVAFLGLSVTPNQTMLAILPDDSRLQAVLLVPSHAAGFIQPGQQVRFRYDAFPHQRFGVHGGMVYSVSRTMLNPGDQAGPLLLQTPAYRVIATLDSESVMAYGEAIPLTPDLTLQADVVRDRMRIIEWIFDPVRAAVSAL